MIKEIKLPEIAENVDVATVISIQVSEGDSISEDQTIAEMESDKAAFDLPADTAGKVKEIKVKEGDEVKVGQVVITVETDDSSSSDASKEKEQESDEKEEKSEPSSDESKEDKNQESEQKGEREEQPDEDKKTEKEKEEKKAPETEEQEEQKEDKSDSAKASEDEEEEREEEPSKSSEKEDESTSARALGDESASAKASTDKEVPASPSVRRLAREIGVDINKVEGTGPYDRITTDDVKAYAKDIVKKSGAEAAEEDYELPDFSKYGEIKREPMDTVRKRTAVNMTTSWQSIPHVFQFDKADVTALEEFREKYAKKIEKKGGKLTVTAILLKIVAKALENFPKFNASLDFKNKEIIFKKYINIGVAVDTERGLLVPVIRDVDQKSISELSVELGEIAEKARNKKIKPDELQGGNFAISNLGGIGGTNFTPIVYRPNVAILGVSRSAIQPVFIDDDFEARLILPLSLSYDHRIIDGAEAARFLRWICESLENPLMTMF
jgi:pyruvate dehydrogenase E2 component (dihydrolipoamide acetyltransferase)